jgi:class 3 adenylate cyclase
MPRCHVCDEPNADSARFCSACGARLEQEQAGSPGARKVVTVVFADVVESTSLVERLEPETARRVLDRFYDAMRAAVESHGGTVEKFIGDAVMAVFGVPFLHEDDALRAVRATTGMHDGLASLNAELETKLGVKLEMRIGVATGEVVAGDPAREQVFVTGDAVNVAARLEAAAPPGDVFLDEPTLRLVRAAVSTEPLGPVKLKGKAESVSVHRLVEVTKRPTRRVEFGFVGRESELGALAGVLDDVVRSRASRLVTVIGTAGVGKSRLVDEFLRTAAGDATVIRGRCLPYGDGITYWPLKEAIGEAAGLTGEENAQEARASVRRLAGSAPDSELVVERVAEAIGLAEAVSEHRGATWAARRLLEEIARKQPLVVVFDDIQWAEPTFLDLVEDIVREATDAPMLIVCMARPELLDIRLSWASSTGASSQVYLLPLTDEESGQLVGSLLGGAELDETARAKIVAAADGLPLFVEEMVAMLVEDGALRRDNGRWVADDLSRVAAPATIHALLAARLDQLDPGDRVVLERGSVEGQVFHRGAVTKLSPEADRPEIEERLSDLVLTELIEPATADFPDDEAFRFHHLLLRDVAYESVQKEERAALHEQFAAWLEEQAGDRSSEYDEIVGYHLEQACRYEEELSGRAAHDGALAQRAAARLGSAGLRAHARGDWAAAASLLSRTLAIAPDDRTLGDALAPKLAEARLHVSPTSPSFLASLGCLVRWRPGHRWTVIERDGEIMLRCKRCGTERHRFGMSEAGGDHGLPYGGSGA